MSQSTFDIIVHTDGACSGNPGPGGWAAVLSTGQHQKEIAGHVWK
jgi:ribonuclease HI